MPRTREHADHYADALTALAAATHRPANVVNTGAGYAIRVDFEYNRFLLATNHEVDGLSDDHASVERWTVRFFQAVADGGAEELVSVECEWLVDAFDRAIAELDRTGNRIEADMELGELSPPSEV
ncbi:hypothetical protein A5N78_09310 [Prescottella equi]|uniref:Uncharacterized protein n=1 Tax=Rhodococcus hoagii TaxID=43767 RepID=A0AAE5ITS6_RHOHA|nr:hypothetical protein [Prescottella equi]AVP70207.1 hypothetical protein C7H75_21160 [Prescottella equi]ERN43683.1 hypothetical protein H849_20910 [Prescottella equi NBRC 101255 = C 7]MBM4526112.1 hypothetical protein [Prescottella equi]MBM4628001.1 hypothetical protein [Prescottella equi]MBM4651885.1 hypothetical protein [Prescottella equi]